MPNLSNFRWVFLCLVFITISIQGQAIDPVDEIMKDSCHLQRSGLAIKKLADLNTKRAREALLTMALAGDESGYDCDVAMRAFLRTASDRRDNLWFTLYDSWLDGNSFFNSMRLSNAKLDATAWEVTKRLVDFGDPFDQDMTDVFKAKAGLEVRAPKKTTPLIPVA